MSRPLILVILLLGLTGCCTSFVVPRLQNQAAKLFASSSSSDASATTPPILCDLQTFLRLTELVSSGGAAKTVIQAGDCCLNGEVETRRAKKLFDGDVVEYGGQTLAVSENVEKRGYVYKPKKKKVKPQAKVIDGELEFGGRFRSEEWRKERKERKAARKNQNANTDIEDDMSLLND